MVEHPLNSDSPVQLTFFNLKLGQCKHFYSYSMSMFLTSLSVYQIIREGIYIKGPYFKSKRGTNWDRTLCATCSPPCWGDSSVGCRYIKISGISYPDGLKYLHFKTLNSEPVSRQQTHSHSTIHTCSVAKWQTFEMPNLVETLSI